MTPELKTEFKRKIFHLLSLVYLGVYLSLGRWNAAIAIGAWFVIVTIVEWIRLRNPSLNEWLMAFFGGIHREKEMHKMSGIVWTTLGCLATITLFGDRPRVVSAGILFLALGDGVAALAGRAWGTHKWPGLDGKKSVEGSLACFLACLVSGFAVGLNPVATVAGAFAGTVFELFPVPIDDNLWLPLLSAGVVAFFSPI